ncbi:MAG TPA: pyridoxamine 5'-phosphate oxidase family protein [Candidatus Nanopelagicales bacterium]|nr:pyridoxamine 5'-phosphate oxidase family protein [Candidatus Nanopelagicales bacterium]
MSEQHRRIEKVGIEEAGGAAPSHAERCRTLAARARTVALGTIARDPAGYPYASLVAVAFDAAGRPLFLISDLAEHTANLKAQPEASALVSEPVLSAEGKPQDPLALGRMTLLGPCRRLTEPAEVEAARAIFLGVHPEAAMYAGFRDFAMYRLEPVSIRYVGGFGRMSWVDAGEYARARLGAGGGARE